MIVSPHLQALLKAHAHQGESNDCGPYTIAIVVNALQGTRLEPKEMSRRMNRPRRRGALLVVRRIPNWATFPWGAADALREHGLPARWRVFANQEALLHGLTSGEILLPIIGEWFPSPWAHIAILAAWDEYKGWGFVDPLTPAATLYWRPYEVFTRQWQAYLRLLVHIPAPTPLAEAILPAGEPAI
ncbi:MAG: hypothetical protein Fur0018_15390 [Anaerolineales bacterium]